jgi:putative copper resistance protein D
MTLDSLPGWLEAAAKAGVYMALLLLVGACGVRWLVLPRVRGLPADELHRCEQRLARVALTTALTLTGALVLRLAAHTTAVFGFAESLSIEAFRVVALQSRWGAGWRQQVLAATVALAAALLIKVHRRIGWGAVACAAIACCLAVPLLGHAAGESKRLAFHAIHVFSAGLWLGSLAAILVASRPHAPFLRRFAPVALSGAALLSATGILSALEYVGPLSNLWGTAYGRVLLTKLALFGAVVGFGYVNWRRWRDAGGSDRIALVEIALALAVVLVTAVLTEIEHP